MIAGLATTILTFAAIVGVGALLRATKLLAPTDARALNTVIIYVGLPAFIFKAVHGARIGLEHLEMIGVAWAVFAVMMLVAFAAERALRLARPTAGGFLLASVLGNTGYIGYPITAALLGTAAVPLAVFSDVFETVFALVLVGLPIASRFGTREGVRANPLKELATFPAVIAVFVALLMRPLPLPEAVSNGLGMVASLTAPLIMLSVGLSLRPRAIGQAALPLSVLVVLKLVVAPLVALGIGSLVLSGDALRVAVLEAGMPSMMLTLVVGERYGLDTDFIASAVFVTTVCAAITVPLVQALAF